jgi:hypothetical protein
VFIEAARQLEVLDAAEHSDILELALHDPNPEVRHRAEKLTAGKGPASRW